jgi:hypothetical protein
MTSEYGGDGPDHPLDRGDHLGDVALAARLPRAQRHSRGRTPQGRLGRSSTRCGRWLDLRPGRGPSIRSPGRALTRRLLAAHTAIARAVAASSGSAARSSRDQLDHPLDLLLVGRAVAAIALFTSLGVASRTGVPCWAAARSTTPRAWPTPRAVWTLREKNSRLHARSGPARGAPAARHEGVDLEQALGSGRSGLVVRQPWSISRRRPAGSFDDPIAQRRRPRVDAQDLHPATSAKTSSGMSKLAVTRWTSSRSSSSSTEPECLARLGRVELDGLLGDHRRLGRLDGDAGASSAWRTASRSPGDV